MNYKLEIKEEAKQDILSANTWYSQQAVGLNIKFIQQLELTLNAIRKNPKTFKRIYKQFRQAALHKFPYVIIYEYQDDVIIVYSIFHSKQNPQKKVKRLRK